MKIVAGPMLSNGGDEDDNDDGRLWPPGCTRTHTERERTLYVVI